MSNGGAVLRSRNMRQDKRVTIKRVGPYTIMVPMELDFDKIIFVDNLKSRTVELTKEAINHMFHEQHDF